MISSPNFIKIDLMNEILEGSKISPNFFFKCIQPERYFIHLKWTLLNKFRTKPNQ